MSDMTVAGRRLLIVNRVHPPDPGATGRLAADLARDAAAAGWQVELLACGKADESRRLGRAIQLTRVAAPSGRSPLALLAQLLALRRGVVRSSGADVAILMSDPPFAWSIAGAARRRGMAVLHWVHDLYPEILRALGAGLPGLAEKLLVAWRAVELARSAGVVAIGSCMCGHLVDTGLPRSLVRLVANWPESSTGPDPAASERWRRRHGFDRRELVVLAGSLGRSMPAHAVAAIAEHLSELRPAALVLVVGEGANADLVDRAAASRPYLVRLRPVPTADLSAMLGAADVHLVLQSPETRGLLVPSRLLSAMASGRPVVAAVPGRSEAARQAGQRAGNLVVDTSDGIDPARIATVLAARLADRPLGLAVQPADQYSARRPLSDWLALLEHAAGAAAEGRG